MWMLIPFVGWIGLKLQVDGSQPAQPNTLRSPPDRRYSLSVFNEGKLTTLSMSCWAGQLRGNETFYTKSLVFSKKKTLSSRNFVKFNRKQKPLQRMLFFPTWKSGEQHPAASGLEEEFVGNRRWKAFEIVIDLRFFRQSLKHDKIKSGSLFSCKPSFQSSFRSFRFHMVPAARMWSNYFERFRQHCEPVDKMAIKN